MFSLTIWLSLLSIAGAVPGAQFPHATPAPYYDARSNSGSHGKSWINYTAVPGFFLQDEATTVPSTFDYVWIPVFLRLWIVISIIAHMLGLQG